MPAPCLDVGAAPNLAQVAQPPWLGLYSTAVLMAKLTMGPGVTLHCPSTPVWQLVSYYGWSFGLEGRPSASCSQLGSAYV